MDEAITNEFPVNLEPFVGQLNTLDVDSNQNVPSLLPLCLVVGEGSSGATSSPSLRGGAGVGTEKVSKIMDE